MLLAQDKDLESATEHHSSYDVIVVGNGPVGVHFVNQLLLAGYAGKVGIFGEEECAPYNRVKLSSFLNGDLPFSALDNPISDHPAIVEHLHCKIVQLDTDQDRVLDQDGAAYRYKHLVLATGSSPHVPNTPGKGLSGVYCFRNLKDTQALFTRRLKSRHTVVIGGGLLGLETAKAMLRHSTQVTLVHHSDRLMNRQLDHAASKRLQAFAEQSGMQIKISTHVTRIDGERNVESVTLNGKQILPCDTVIFATGIRPNTDLAMDAHISINKGIRIDERLSTSDENVFAIGECADFQGQVFGLVAPGLEQACILAKNLCGEKLQYKGATLVTELKVMGLTVFSMGKVGDEFERQIDSELIYSEEDCYRRLLLEKGRLVGAIFIGKTDEIKSLQQAIENAIRLWPWQKNRFLLSGNLFTAKQSSITSLPDSTLICNCQQVTAGQVRHCMKSGQANFAQLQQTLLVSTVCGTCKPLVQTLLAQPVEQLPIKKVLLFVSTICAIAAYLLLTLSPPEPTQSVQNPGWDWLWTDSLARQISGFVMLGLTTLGLLLSLRKRLPKWRWLSFDFWRNWHVVLTACALLTLFAHTGTSLGDGINRWLIVNFIAIVGVGILSGVVASLEGYWVSPKLKSIKRSLVWGHILTFWPFPVLLAYHVLSVYYF